MLAFSCCHETLVLCNRIGAVGGRYSVEAAARRYITTNLCHGASEEEKVTYTVITITRWKLDNAVACC